MSRPTYYRLVGKKPIPSDGGLEWARAFEDKNRVVGRTEIGKVTVSTIFLGLDHNFMDEGPPILFETMVFGLPGDEEPQERYTTWAEAEAGHQRWVTYASSMADALPSP